MTAYRVAACRFDSHGSLTSAKDAKVVLDTDMAGRRDAMNLVGLLLSALAACMLKGIPLALIGEGHIQIGPRGSNILAIDEWQTPELILQDCVCDPLPARHIWPPKNNGCLRRLYGA